MLLKKHFAFSTNEKLFNRTFLTLFAVHVLENSHKTNADRERKRGRERQLPGAIGLAQIYRFLLVCIDFRVVGRNFQLLTMDNARAQ